MHHLLLSAAATALGGDHTSSIPFETECQLLYPTDGGTTPPAQRFSVWRTRSSAESADDASVSAAGDGDS